MLWYVCNYAWYKTESTLSHGWASTHIHTLTEIHVYMLNVRISFTWLWQKCRTCNIYFSKMLPGLRALKVRSSLTNVCYLFHLCLRCVLTFLLGVRNAEDKMQNIYYIWLKSFYMYCEFVCMRDGSSFISIYVRLRSSLFHIDNRIYLARRFKLYPVLQLQRWLP